MLAPMLPQYPFDFRQAQRFITALTGSQASTLVLQFIDDTAKKRKECNRVHIGSLPQLTDIIGKLNAAQRAVYLQVNSGRRGKHAITGVRACFIDDDGTSPLPPIPRLPPSIVVASSENSRNRHYYWLLAEGQSIDKWSDIQRHLALFYGTDKSMVNLDRVMRLPGTWNMHGPCPDESCAKCKKRRRAAPERVTLLEAHPERKYTYEQLLAAHPLPAALVSQPALSSSAPREAPTDSAVASAKRIGFWLTVREIPHTQINDVTFRLKRCVFNPTHVDKMMIRVQSRGGIWAGCWHDSCGGNVNRWAELKDKVGGWASDGAPFVRGDDIELAQRLLTDLAGVNEEAIVGTQDELWRYDTATGLWVSYDESELYRHVARYAGQRVGKKSLKLNHASIYSVIASAKTLSGDTHFFGEAPPGVAFTNGVLMATPNGAAFVPHDAENRLNLGLPHAYAPDAKCDRWRAYLAACFEGDEDAADKIDLLQEFLGACLIGIAPRYQRALVLYGQMGENGKSVFTHVASELFPKEQRQSIKPQDWGKEYYKAALAGVRLNVVSELPEAEIVSGDSFKAVISGDEMDARNPAGRPFQHAPIAGHLFACNRLPGTADHTNAFWRRFLIVEWNRTFPAGHPMRDDTLKEALVASEMAGIAAWAVAGASRLLARGAFTLPASHHTLLRTWRVEVDSVASFLEECCVIDDCERTPMREIYPFFKKWCEEAGRRAIANSTFGRRLRENRVHVVEGKESPYYGLIIRENVKKQWRYDLV